ncbi:hypothetical protein ACFE04_023620 [Oxalis oulophora]
MKAEKTSILPLIFLLLIILPFSSADMKSGGFTPIKDPKSKEIMDMGLFAVKEHNLEAKTSLVFNTVVSGQVQAVAGANYKLIISATDGISTNNYEAVVLERLSGLMTLTSFKRL